MLRKLFNRKGQNTAEYAILISLVIAGIIAMQTYAQRALQARVRDGSQFMVENTSGIGATDQYEPYYLDKTMNNTLDSTEGRNLAAGGTSENTLNSTAGRTGTSTDTYDGVAGH
jgi:hypothetical protein